MKVVVIGAGPSGLICGINASKNGHDVTILEKNEKAGKKIYITGKGRCNVTNNCDVNEFMNNVVRNNRFLFSAINAFKPIDTINYFEERGVPLVTERGNRVFPKSYKASDITRVLLNECEKNKVKIYYHTNIYKINKNSKNKYVISYNNNLSIEADKLVVATGGLSYPTTGSTGDGYKIAKEFGHTIVNTYPSLCYLRVSDKVSYDADGLTLKNVSLHAYNDKVNYSFEGEMNFSKGIIDGPIVLKLSSLIQEEKVLRLFLDLKIGLSKEELDARLVRDFSQNPNLSLKEELLKLLPIQMIKDFLIRIKIDGSSKLNSIRKEQREKIVSYLKRYDLDYLGIGDYNRAIVTRGGISIKEINPKTFESKIVPNLYFVGEVLDVDAFTGGFNMQIALSTGYCCGKHMK